MTAGDDLKRVRVIEASADETIEIRWRRRIPLRSQDPTKPIDDVCVMRYSAPPASTWEAHTKEPDPND